MRFPLTCRIVICAVALIGLIATYMFTSSQGNVYMRNLNNIDYDELQNQSMTASYVTEIATVFWHPLKNWNRRSTTPWISPQPLISTMPFQLRSQSPSSNVKSIPPHTAVNVSVNIDIASEVMDKFMLEQAEIQRHRRARLKEVCSRLDVKHRHEDFFKNRHDLSFVVDEKYKLVYCNLPKVACTSWKRVFLVLNGIMNDTDDLPQTMVNNVVGPRKLKFLTSYSVERRATILKEYTKFLVVRQPFQRILSAYNNKLSPASTSKSADPFQKDIGVYIMEKYRNNSSLSLNGTTLGNRREESKIIVKNKQKIKYDLRFGEFVKFLISSSEGKKRYIDNRHWMEMHRVCHPCQINYDIIGHFESLENDASYILRRVHADGVVQFPYQNGSSPTNSSSPSVYKSSFKGLSREDLEKLYQKYSLDFELFGYEKPEFAIDGGRRVK